MEGRLIELSIGLSGFLGQCSYFHSGWLLPTVKVYNSRCQADHNRCPSDIDLTSTSSSYAVACIPF